MAKFSKFNLVRYTILGTLGGLFGFILSAIIRSLNIPAINIGGDFLSVRASVVNIDLRRQVLETGQFKELGLRFLEFIEGTFNFNVMEFFGILVGFVLILMIGRVAVGYMQQSKLVVKYRVVLSFLAGGFIFSFIAAFLGGLPFLTSLLSISLYALIIGFAVQIMVNRPQLKFIRE